MICHFIFTPAIKEHLVSQSLLLKTDYITLFHICMLHVHNKCVFKKSSICFSQLLNHIYSLATTAKKQANKQQSSDFFSLNADDPVAIWCLVFSVLSSQIVTSKTRKPAAWKPSIFSWSFPEGLFWGWNFHLLTGALTGALSRNPCGTGPLSQKTIQTEFHIVKCLILSGC